MKTTTENKGITGHEEIAELARTIWEQEGRQTGRDLEYWLRAERELRPHGDSQRDASVDVGTPIHKTR